MALNKIIAILATDCGSTTSKARFFRKVGEEYRFIAAGEAPTTVEAPFEDVTQGVRNAIREVEELVGYTLLDQNGVITPSLGESRGVDLYVTTSSAGGGLQMSVAGVIKQMTAESAERAALGAGAIVMDVMAVDDGRPDFEKIERLRNLRPDMIVVAGGIDGGATTPVIETAELIKAAGPKARLGLGYKLPIIYSGNKDLSEKISTLFSNDFALKIVDNIRPVLEVENPEPTRNAVHELFMEHVMSHAPGYNKLMKWTSIPIMPTPAAEGKMFQVVASTYHENVIGVGLGGATTNIYSIYNDRFVRTVSANLGMSYSVCNVLKSAGIENIMRWLPFEIDEADVRNRLRNKMIRPTTIPQTLEDLVIEQAVAREALRLGFDHHKLLARPLRGITREREYTDIFEQKTYTETYIDMLNVDWVAGTGGLLSHAPNRAQSALILVDGFQPEGVTKLAQDSVFMIPHLGVLSNVHPDIAMEIFEKDCLIRLGTCIAARQTLSEGKIADVDSSEVVMSVRVELPNGVVRNEEMSFGTIKRIPLRTDEKAQVEIKPAKGFNVGPGPGHSLHTTIDGGVVGVILDARGRPLVLPESDDKRRKVLLEWFAALNVYSQNALGGN